MANGFLELAQHIPDGERESAILTRAAWNTDGDWPHPEFPMICGDADCDAETQIKHLAFFIRPKSGHPYRCDVAVKCRSRGNVWVYGVMISERMFRQHVPAGWVDEAGEPILQKIYELDSLRAIKRVEQFKADGGQVIATVAV